MGSSLEGVASLKKENEGKNEQARKRERQTAQESSFCCQSDSMILIEMGRGNVAVFKDL